jgi:2-succinyl-6-hydroxy-2,4-cyclohexadiene-1-carboxylate synthase
MPFQTIDGVDYYYEESGTGPALVLLHGFTGSVQNWAAHRAALDRHFRTIAVDLPGHGQTAAPVDPDRYRIEQSARDLALLLAQVAPEAVNLLGYSMGGRLALFFATVCPEQVARLILESASPGLAEEEARRQRIAQDEALAQRIESGGIEAFVDYWERIPLFASQQRLPENVRARLRGQRLQNRPVGLANSLRGMGTGAQPSLWTELAQLQMPVHLIAGELDEKFVEVNRRMADLIPEVTLDLVEDVGHTVHLEAPGRIQAIIHERVLHP